MSVVLDRIIALLLFICALCPWLTGDQNTAATLICTGYVASLSADIREK